MLSNLEPHDEKENDNKPGNAETWTERIPIVKEIVESMLGSYVATANENYLFNAVNGMYLTGEKTFPIMGVKNVKI